MLIQHFLFISHAARSNCAHLFIHLPLTFHKYNFLVRDDRTNFKALKDFSFLSCGTKFDQSNKRRQKTTNCVYLWKHIQALFQIKYVYSLLKSIFKLIQVKFSLQRVIVS
jgi:hypothetical protein